MHPVMKPFYSLIAALLLTLASTGSPAEAADTGQTTQTRLSSNGDYEVTIDSWLKPLQLGRMHAWTVTIHNPDGKPVTDADIRVGGGMPIHNHGFPTEPEATKQLEDGVYLIEGIKFSMSGPWLLFFDITSAEKTDSVAFDIDM